MERVFASACGCPCLWTVVAPADEQRPRSRAAPPEACRWNRAADGVDGASMPVKLYGRPVSIAGSCRGVSTDFVACGGRRHAGGIVGPAGVDSGVRRGCRLRERCATYGVAQHLLRLRGVPGAAFRRAVKRGVRFFPDTLARRRSCDAAADGASASGTAGRNGCPKTNFWIRRFWKRTK